MGTKREVWIGCEKIGREGKVLTMYAKVLTV